MTKLEIVDPLQLIRRRPEMFIPGGRITAAILAAGLVDELFVLQEEPLRVQRSGDWGLVSSSREWMNTGSTPAEEVLFSQLVPFPEAGQNSSYFEIVLVALADAVVTRRAAGVKVVSGDLAPTDAIFERLKELSSWERTIAFRVTPKPISLGG